MVSQGPRAFTREFKLAALARMDACPNVLALARELGVARGLLYQWRRTYEAGGVAALRTRGRPPSTATPGIDGSASPPADDADRRIGALERRVRQQTLELEFLRAALERVSRPRKA